MEFIKKRIVFNNKIGLIIISRNNYRHVGFILVCFSKWQRSIIFYISYIANTMWFSCFSFVFDVILKLFRIIITLHRNVIIYLNLARVTSRTSFLTYLYLSKLDILLMDILLVVIYYNSEISPHIMFIITHSGELGPSRGNRLFLFDVYLFILSNFYIHTHKNIHENNMNKKATAN